MHPGRDEMAASICAAPLEAVGTGLGNEAVKTTGSSQTSFQNLSPAKCSPGRCRPLCQAEPILQSPSAWLFAVDCHGSPSAEGTQPFPTRWDTLASWNCCGSFSSQKVAILGPDA